ncbi:hypothetical protein C8Q74DRAFT_626587 [Fomes fomentarius]|nr:hypothetical protein C8Q74DRAFT_626587 [Fomes fomentarius]
MTTRFQSDIRLQPKASPDPPTLLQWPLPPAPKWPCPWLNEEENSRYLRPLVDSHGWRTRAIALEVKLNENKAGTSTELEKRFTFDTVDVLDKFLEDMKSLESSEKHHATKEITRDPAAVVVRVHTHSALRPPSNSSDSETMQERKQPGITIRDIRFAYLLDELIRQPT